MKRIVFAGGCFWGVEAYFNTIGGVEKTSVGYANGNTENPSYEEVCKNTTGFAEACRIEYDEKIVSLEDLLTAFWLIVDPTLKDRQAHDIGNQYRTGIYYQEAEDLPVILAARSREQKKYEATIVTEIGPLTRFYDAEEFHQNYLEKNPSGYCHIPKELLRKKS